MCMRSMHGVFKMALRATNESCRPIGRCGLAVRGEIAISDRLCSAGGDFAAPNLDVPRCFDSNPNSTAGYCQNFDDDIVAHNNLFSVPAR